jgi:hypothetical protein
MHGRRRTRQIENSVDRRRVVAEWLANVVIKHLEFRMLHHAPHVAIGASGEIVDAPDVVSGIEQSLT